jgi:hypothetical protein
MIQANEQNQNNQAEFNLKGETNNQHAKGSQLGSNGTFPQHQQCIRRKNN